MTTDTKHGWGVTLIPARVETHILKEASCSVDKIPAPPDLLTLQVVESLPAQWCD